MRKDALVCTACGVTRASLVRARAARALSEAAESRRAVAHVPGVRVYCTGCGAVRGASVSSCVLLWLFCGWGAAEGLTQKVSLPPNPKGWIPRSLPHHPLGPTSWAPVQRGVPDCSSFLSSRSLESQQTVGCRSHARATPCLIKRQRC